MKRREEIFREGWTHRRMDVVQTLVNFAAARLPEGEPLLPRYLEIGCRDDETFANIFHASKIGVDPVMGGTMRMTSDAFFAMLRHEQFDVIFVDGDHSFRQSLVDAENAVVRLDDGGMLILHDACPREARLTHEHCSGEVWRTFLTIRREPLLDAVLLDMRDDPVGLGIVLRRPNTRPIISPPDPVTVSYEEMIRNLDDWMRPSTPEQVIEFLMRS